MLTRRALLKFVGFSALSATMLGGYAFGAEPMLMTRVKRYAAALDAGTEAACRAHRRHPCLHALDDAQQDRGHRRADQ